ncbi:hypothetical protein BpHYR1_028142 [Brachionus plicatilis]|uniref:Uncharacterized protein n=1 Tax=Brachionus plicatilis TaxID=10195 RepID=A0A3M7PP35_BRAPC|nr:hypothetical protein BpHYR1_028142 [Brachionus plicatilis]
MDRELILQADQSDHSVHPPFTSQSKISIDSFSSQFLPPFRGSGLLQSLIRHLHISPLLDLHLTHGPQSENPPSTGVLVKGQTLLVPRIPNTIRVHATGKLTLSITYDSVFVYCVMSSSSEENVNILMFGINIINSYLDKKAIFKNH